MVKTSVKRLILSILALVTGLLITEIFVRYAIYFPTFGVKEYVIGLDPRGFDKSRVYYPYSKFYSLEGGYKVFQRNNLGLPGSDVKPGKKYIFVLGSSFIEAMEVEPGKIATSILNGMCESLGYQVINLGYRGNTPYEQYCRLKYYSRIYKPSIVVLALDSTYEPWYKQRDYRQDDPELLKDFGTKDRDFLHNLYRVARNSSALINLSVPALLSKRSEDNGAPTAEDNQDSITPEITALLKSISLLNAESAKFVVVSFIKSKPAVEALERELSKQNIPFFHKDIKSNDNIIVGHLNEQGNHDLGSFVFEALSLSGALP